MPTGDLEGRVLGAYTGRMEPARQQQKKGTPPVAVKPEKDVGVAVKRDGKFYQIVTIRKDGDGKAREVPGRRGWAES